MNRVKGLLAGQGITDYEPLQKDRRARLEALRTFDNNPLPERLKSNIPIKDKIEIGVTYQDPAS